MPTGWESRTAHHWHFVAMSQHAAHVFREDNPVFAVSGLEHHLTGFYIHTGSRVLSGFVHFKLGTQHFHLRIVACGQERSMHIPADGKYTFPDRLTARHSFRMYPHRMTLWPLGKE